jgi:hypothetical protein
MPNELDPHLEPLRPLLGRTFRADIREDDGKLSVDVSRWERALNGRAVRNINSLNDGEYGGETIIYWDAASGSVRTWYFTTAGFWTQGTMRFEGNRILTHERLTNNKQGITEVRGTSELLADGSLKLEAEYLVDDKWGPGHSGVFREDPSAKVRFR